MKEIIPLHSCFFFFYLFDLLGIKMVSFLYLSSSCPGILICSSTTEGRSLSSGLLSQIILHIWFTRLISLLWQMEVFWDNNSTVWRFPEKQFTGWIWIMCHHTDQRQKLLSWPMAIKIGSLTGFLISHHQPEVELFTASLTQFLSLGENSMYDCFVMVILYFFWYGNSKIKSILSKKNKAFSLDSRLDHMSNIY